MPGDIEQLIDEALTAGWAWSVFGPLSSVGPLASGVEDSEDAAVKCVEDTMSSTPGAAFGGITSATGGKVCRRSTTGGFRWWETPA